MKSTTTKKFECVEAASSNQHPQAYFSIYENSQYLGDSFFAKSQISIGSSCEADVVLEHQSVADIHALVHFENGQPFLTNKFPKNGLRLNGRCVGLSELQHKDVIDIGPFSLKIGIGASILSSTQSATAGVKDKPAASRVSTKKTANITENKSGGYCMTLTNRYESADARQNAAARLAKLLRTDLQRVQPLLDKSHHVLKRDLDYQAAKMLERAFLSAGIACAVQAMDTTPVPETPVLPPPEQAENMPEQRPVKDSQSTQDDSEAEFKPFLTIDEDEEEEEVWEAPFSLKAKLCGPTKAIQYHHRSPSQLKIVKTIGDSVIDVFYLQKRQKYTIFTNEGQIRLAETKSNNQSFVYLKSDFSGHIIAPNRDSTWLDSYKTAEYLYRKRKQIYRIPFPENDEMVVSDGECEYRISKVGVNPSPEVQVAEIPPAFTWRHWAWSGGVHLMLVLCICVYMYLQAVAPRVPEPHFVKIDQSLFDQLKAKRVPKPPEKKTPPPKPEPKQVAQKVKPVKKAPKKKPPQQLAKKSKRTSKVAKTRQPSKHPKAGGGFGKGNIKNRNINQAGLLSVLSSSSLTGPSEALASVTNLDAVQVPGATDKNFTVGGLKGTLGNGKIAMAGGQIMQTKGGKQVLRSAGARGKGTVAALERGTTGKKRVKAMVTAKMSRSVKIEGGMSREMVKRIIDQHMEEIVYLYEMALRSNPNIMGRIVFEWKILMSGRVGEIRIVASSVNSNELHDGMKAAIKSWQFPKPVGTEVVVSYPFVLDLATF